MFDSNMMDDEGVLHTSSNKWFVWAVFLQKGNELDVQRFLDDLGFKDKSIAVGTISDSVPTDLVNSAGWTSPQLLTMAPQMEAC